MCQAREAGHVQHAPSAVAHVRQHERRHARPMLCQRGRDAGRAVDQEELVPAAQRPRQALHDVHIRPKVAALYAFLVDSALSALHAYPLPLHVHKFRYNSPCVMIKSDRGKRYEDYFRLAREPAAQQARL